MRLVQISFEYDEYSMVVNTDLTDEEIEEAYIDEEQVDEGLDIEQRLDAKAESLGKKIERILLDSLIL